MKVVLCAVALHLAAAPDSAAQGTSKAQEHADRGLHLAKAGDLQKAEVELRRAVELSSDDPLYLSTLGNILWMQQRSEEANLCFEKALKIDPNNMDIRRNLAANQWQSGNLHAARENLEHILKRTPSDKSATLLLGMVAENLKDYARAARLLGSVSELVQQRSESVAALSRSYYQLGQREKARETLKAIEGKSSDPAGVFLGGRVATESGDYETAERLFKSVWSTYPDTATLGYNLALIQFRTGRFDESRKTLLSLIEKGYETSDTYNLLGWTYHKQREFKQAIGAFERAIDRDPSEESNYLDLATVLSSKKLFLPAALERVKRAVEILPTSQRLYGMKGLIELRMQLYTDAIQSFARDSELNPASPQASVGLATAQLGAGMTEVAAATFEKGMNRFSGNAFYCQEYARLLLKIAKTGDTAAEARAVSLLATALALDSSLSDPHYQLGNLALKKGKPKEALQQLEVAAKLDPKSSKIRYALAHTYRRLGRREETARELEAYQNLRASEDSSDEGLLAITVDRH
jgi:tetratricopeptide (TPR) repeat protein